MYIILMSVWWILRLCLCWTPQVSLPSGRYIGQQLSTYNNLSTYFSFRGIKFASAPARFQEGRPVAESNRTFNATEFGPACYQSLAFLGVTLPISEDCLYLNVYSPDLDGALPVIVFIYGGSFISGATNMVRPDYFMETGRVVVLTIAYRVSAFGFLYLDDAKYPANLGFRDQILALRWVQSNIRSFGGDADRVTINGQSAGAASVAALIHSPLAKGLFIGAISESGVLSSRWAVQPRCTGLQRRNSLSRKLGCGRFIPPAAGAGGGGAGPLVTCLRSRSPGQVIQATKLMNIPSFEDSFPPIVEPLSARNPVITYFPWLNRTNSTELVPWITGVNNREGVTMVGDKLPNNFFLRFGAAIFSGPILANILYYNNLASYPYLTSISIKYHYFDVLRKDVTELGVQLLSDGFFNFPLVRSAAVIRSPTYVYYFNYRQRKETAGVGHGGELKYIWPNAAEYLRIRANGSDSDLRLSRDMTSAWIDFAYDQVAKFSNVTWDRYDYRTDQVLIIDNGGVRMGPNPSRRQNNFWRRLRIDDNPRTKSCFP